MTTRSTLHLACLPLLALTTASAPSPASAAVPQVTDQPILVIGASFADGRLPFDDELQAPFGGAAVGFGSYLSLGDALVKRGSFVINEGQAGATSFARDFCLAELCVPDVGWQGYDTQLQKAVARVALVNPADPAQVLGYNAQYVFISLGNDCLHSGAAGVPQLDATPCTQDEVDEYLDRVVSVAQVAEGLGLVPVFSEYPDYEDLDLAVQAAATGLLWVADEAQYGAIATTWAERIATDLPGAILVDAWKNMDTIDGLHPTPTSALKAAKRVRKAIAEHEAADE